MLECNIDPQNYVLPCYPCSKCSDKTRKDKGFKKNNQGSHILVEQLMAGIEKYTGCNGLRATDIDPSPDIVLKWEGKLLCRVEAKMLNDDGFMTAQKNTGLYPREALTINDVNLRHYFDLAEKDLVDYKREIPTFIVWQFNRPCEDGLAGATIFQELSVIQDIYDETEERLFIRGGGGNRKKKYHFSIRECRPIEELFTEICKLRNSKVQVQAQDAPEKLPTNSADWAALLFGMAKIERLEIAKLIPPELEDSVRYCYSVMVATRKFYEHPSMKGKQYESKGQTVVGKQGMARQALQDAGIQGIRTGSSFETKTDEGT